jgi:hypothetical protein
MKNTLGKIAVVFCLTTALQLHGQGFVYDQQSATTPERIISDSLDLYIEPLYQSFVPALSSIGFVQLQIGDYMDSDTSGARICVGLYSGSPGSFSFVATTEVVYLPPNFNNDQLVYSGVTNFYFATPIALTVGQTYYLSPIKLTGDHSWSVVVTDDTYPLGQLYGKGAFTPPTDLWFREGIIVPEPSGLELLAMGGLLTAGNLGCKGKMQQQLI